MKWRRGCAVAFIFCLVAGVLLIVYASTHFEEWGVGIHQKSVTRSLADWEKEYGRIGNWDEADRAIGMLEYVQSYYVPGPGYRSNPRTEAALEEQRARTVAAIVSALREFTGEDFGTDPEEWRAWRSLQIQGQQKR
jgi:hypothetical protein